MTSIIANIINTVIRQMQHLIRIQYCVIVEIDYPDGNPGVQNHSYPDSKFFNTVSVKARMIRQKGASAKKDEHLDILVLQRDIGNRFGQPWTPRVGDMCAVLFFFNNKPLLLGTVVTPSQKPVVRGPASPTTDGQYDRVDKWCQWQRVTFDENLDASKHPEGKLPICEKLFHGPPKGETGPGRDWQMVYDCKKGDKDPTCKDCIKIDSVPRSAEGWDKVYSEDTESCEAPHKRMERHAKCGSYIRIESETGRSLEYSEGIGHIRIGNNVGEDDPRGHINFKGDVASGAGTIDMHAQYERVAYASENSGARTSVVANQDTSVLWACESIYFDKAAYIRIMKDGQIIIHTPYKITIESTGTDILIKSPTVIEENVHLVHMTENCLIDGHLDVDSITVGSCSHVSCSCEGGGSGGRTSDGCVAALDPATGKLTKTDPTGMHIPLSDKVMDQVSCAGSNNACGCRGGVAYSFDGIDWSEISPVIPPGYPLASAYAGCDGSKFCIDTTGNVYQWNAIVKSWEAVI
jgi:hypothetical protein